MNKTWPQGTPYSSLGERENSVKYREKNKVGKGIKMCVAVTVLNRGVREGLTEKCPEPKSVEVREPFGIRGRTSAKGLWQ